MRGWRKKGAKISSVNALKLMNGAQAVFFSHCSFEKKRGNGFRGHRGCSPPLPTVPVFVHSRRRAARVFGSICLSRSTRVDGAVGSPFVLQGAALKNK